MTTSVEIQIRIQIKFYNDQTITCVSFAVVVSCLQVLFERGKISDKIQAILSSSLSGAMKEGLRVGTEFWDSTKTLKCLADEQYFKESPNKHEGDDEEGRDEVHWPECLQQMVADGSL